MCSLMMSVTARRLESEKGSECVVVERCFRVGASACGCVPLYPLFIHSLLSQSLGNETGDGERRPARGVLSRSIHFLLFFSPLTLKLLIPPPRRLHLSVALDHFKMSGPSPQMAETEEKYHRSYLGSQTMNPNCS